MKIGVWADGGKGAGLGHLGRCLGIAQAIQAHHRFTPTFIETNSEVRGWIRAHGFPIGKLGRETWDLMILDSYRVSRAQIKTLRKSARKLAYLDDVKRTDIPCDWILNGSLSARSGSYVGTSAQLLLGPRFQPLRKEFWKRRPARRISGTIQNILVTLGGTTPPQLMKRILRTTSAVLPQAKLHVVVGPFTLMRAIQSKGKIVIHKAPSTLKQLMQRCDLAVTGAGQTLYELACIGLTGVAVPIADNQLPHLAGFETAGVFLSAGRPTANDFDKRLKTCLSQLQKRSLRQQMSAAGQSLIDGRGAGRVADSLVRN